MLIDGKRWLPRVDIFLTFSFVPLLSQPIILSCCYLHTFLKFVIYTYKKEGKCE